MQVFVIFLAAFVAVTANMRYGRYAVDSHFAPLYRVPLLYSSAPFLQNNFPGHAHHFDPAPPRTDYHVPAPTMTGYAVQSYQSPAPSSFIASDPMPLALDFDPGPEPFSFEEAHLWTTLPQQDNDNNYYPPSEVFEHELPVIYTEV